MDKMKYVKENINEKFEEESDPIHDMQIGHKKKIDMGVFTYNRDNYTRDQLKQVKQKYLEKRKKHILDKIKKEWVGKYIEGEFRNPKTYSDIKGKFKIKNIDFDFSYNGEITDFIITTDKGKKYRLFTRNYYADYIITSY